MPYLRVVLHCMLYVSNLRLVCEEEGSVRIMSSHRSRLVISTVGEMNDGKT